MGHSALATLAFGLLACGALNARAAELQGGDTPVVVRAAQVPLPEGAVEAGEIRQPELVSEALRELWQRGRTSRTVAGPDG